MQAQTTLTINIVVDTSDTRTAVSASAIVTPYDTIPIPQSGNLLVVQSGQTLNWNVVDETRYDAALIFGTLRMARAVNTRLRATTCFIFPGGTLDRGTINDPIAAKCELIFNDVPLDAVNDPGQYWNGLIGLGTYSQCGLTKDAFLRLAVEPKAGQSTITLVSPPVGWQVGDTVVLPDSRQLMDGERWTAFVAKWERVKIAAINGNVVTLETPLLYDHPAAYNSAGTCEAMPHAAILSQNIITKSENASGTRGYMLFTRRAWVDINGGQFGGLGRTKIGAASSTNVNYRFPITFKNHIGPKVSPVPGVQYRIRGVSHFCPLDPMPFRWGIYTDSCYGEISGNALFNWAGAGIVGAANAVKNVVKNNFVCGIRGNDNPRNNTGNDGSGYFFWNFDNYIRDNVAASCVGIGYQGIVTGIGFNLQAVAATSTNTKVPAYPGADRDIEYTLVDRQLQPLLQLRNNEAYGCMATGFTLWWLGTDGYVEKAAIAPSVMDACFAWHCWEEGFFGYPTANLTIDNFTVIAAGKSLLNSVNVSGAVTTGDYRNVNLTVRNLRTSNIWRSIYGCTNVQGTFEIVTPDLTAKRGIDIPMLCTPGVGGGVGPRVTNIRSPRFTMLDSTANKISKSYGNPSTINTNYVVKDEVFVYDMDGTPGDSFKVYLPQQDANFITPMTGTPQPGCKGSPVSGITNAQNLAQYGVCISGELLPSTAIDRTGIGGKIVALGV